MSAAQRVGQLLMVGCPSSGDCETLHSQIGAGLIGSVILTGRSYAGVQAIKAKTAVIQSWASTSALPKLFIAVDQEGGEVQSLQGPGFDRIPSALELGSTFSRQSTANATRWGGQLRAAGINLDLAPVLDTVPSAVAARDNPPIGGYDREFGYTPTQVARAGSAFIAGLLAAGVDSTIKHFPGLGRVVANTDTSAHVTDDKTTRTDPYLLPYREAVRQGTPFVMMSTAIYQRLDPGVPAAFSSIIVDGLLRGDLGFTGVVISDDLGISAQVRSVTPGQRAVRFVGAGGDVVLTVDSSLAPAMRTALIAKMKTDPGFAKLVERSVLRVLAAKLQRGLLH